MNNMFYQCKVFNQSLSNWNTGNISSMQSMFNRCFVFDQPVQSWNWNVNNVNSSGFNLMFQYSGMPSGTPDTPIWSWF
jgi:surface protein